MSLIDWLTSVGRTQTWLAGQVGLSVGQMSRIVRGTSQASTEVAEAVRRLSRGAVGPEDLHRVRVAYLISIGRIDPDPSPLSAPCSEARAA